MKTFSNGVFTPPEVEVLLENEIIPSNEFHPILERLELCAGSTPGSAIVSFPANASDNVTAPLTSGLGSPHIGQKVQLKIGGKTIFRGVLLQAPTRIDESEDKVELFLVEEKWLLGGRIIGQVGIGSKGTPAGAQGFQDVGFEIIFNKNAQPDTGPAYDFLRGKDAVYWTLRDVVNFIFTWYVPATIATLDDSTIAHAAWDRRPAHLNLTGQSVLQALDQVTELAGESWTMVPGDTACEFRAIRSTLVPSVTRKISFFKPWKNSKATAATDGYPQSTDVNVTIERARDTMHAVSAPIVMESVYSNKGDDPLLTRHTSFKDKDYAARYGVDVSKYSEHSLGNDLSANGVPKEWRTELVTKMKSDGSAYLTKAQIDATPAYTRNKRVEIPVWLSVDGTEGNRRFCTGGYRINCKNAMIDFKGKVELAEDTGSTRETVTISDWTNVGIWITVATILEYPETYKTADGSSYLADHMVQLIAMTDLDPERRLNSYLPDLAGNNNAVSVLAATEEKYHNISTELEDAAKAALAQVPRVESSIDCTLPFFPIWDIGDGVKIIGRNLGAIGDEVIISIQYDVHEQFTTRIRATNVMKAVHPDKFVEVRK